MCMVELPTTTYFFSHMALHDNPRKASIPCIWSKCSSRFRYARNAKKHFKNTHNKIASKNTNVVKLIDRDIVLQCELGSCFGKLVNGEMPFMSHLSKHLDSNEKVKCPFEKCDKDFNMKTSFKAHISRQHRHHGFRKFKSHLLVSSARPTALGPQPVGAGEVPSGGPDDNPDGLDDEPGGPDDAPGGPDDAPGGPDDDSDVEMSIDGQEQKRDIGDSIFLSLVDFYNFLGNVLCIGYINVQFVAEKIHSVVELNCRLLEAILKEECPANYTRIVHRLRNEDVLRNSHLPKGQGQSGIKSLFSEYERNRHIEEMMTHVPPKQIALNPGRPKNETKTIQYVPIVETLKVLLEDPTYKEQARREAELMRQAEDSPYLGDLKNGFVFRDNKFFRENPDAIPIVLYR